MENKQVLDLSALPEEQYNKILNGWNAFCNDTKKARYFGEVDKNNIRVLAKCFGYKTISYSTLSVLILGCGCAGYLALKKKLEKKEEQDK